MSRRDQRTCDLVAWLHRRRADFPDGFSGEALGQRSDWELARYAGMLRLKVPEVRGFDGGPLPLRLAGAPQPSCVVTYYRSVPKAPLNGHTPDCVPMGLGHAPSAARFLAKLARRGVLELVPGSKPKRYVFPSKRLVFGVDTAEAS